MSNFFEKAFGIIRRLQSSGLKPTEIKYESLIAPEPAVERLLHVEDALRELRPGGTCFIDKVGNVYRDKTPFVKREVEPLVSFMLREDNVFSVFGGIPSLNPTFCGAGGRNRDRGAVLEYSTSLSSGDWMALGPDCVITIPSSRAVRVVCPEDMVASHLAAASPGEILQLGRSLVPTLPDTVSRIHATVEILEKHLETNDSIRLKVRVYPGIPAKENILIDEGSSRFSIVYGQRTVAAGARLALGYLGDIVLPHAVGSIGEVAKTTSSLIAQGLPHRGGDAIQALEKQQAHQFKVDFLRAHIIEGLKLIQLGEYDKAQQLFYSPKPLTLVGYKRLEGVHHLMREITPKSVRRQVDNIAQRSWFKPQQKAVELATSGLAHGVEPTSDEQRELLQTLQAEIALLHAEEYVHVLQDLKGSCVSKLSALLPVDDKDEADVAVFFAEQGVQCTQEFVHRRYPARARALATLEGLQTDAHSASFRQALRDLPLGKKLLVGRDAHSEASPEEQAFSIFTDGSEQHGEHDIIEARVAERASLPSVVAVIERQCDGSFLLSPYEPAAEPLVYIPDATGSFYGITDSARVEPGTPFYVGKGFRFVLEA